MDKEEKIIDVICRSKFDFSDNQLALLRASCIDMYKVFKAVFDSPRLYYKPYSSVMDYKIKRQRVYDTPDNFYNFTMNNINVHIRKRRFDIYSVAVCGIKVDDSLFSKMEKIDSEIFPHEKEFSCGYDYLGHFKRSDFTGCVNLFYKVILSILCKRFDIDVKHVLRQMEFIF